MILSSTGLVSLLPARFLAVHTNQPESAFCRDWITRLPGPRERIFLLAILKYLIDVKLGSASVECY